MTGDPKPDPKPDPWPDPDQPPLPWPEPGDEPEEWRPVVGWEGLYEVSSLGRVRSLDRFVSSKPRRDGTSSARLRYGQQLALCDGAGGYLIVGLSRDGTVKTFYVHQLVCEAWHGTRPEGHQAAHGDSNRRNNRPGNLRWATRRENFDDRMAHGTWPFGEGNGNRKLTEEQVKAIRAWSGPLQAAADAFAVHIGTVERIRARKNWKHV
jgi:hypothetical protein